MKHEVRAATTPASRNIWLLCPCRWTANAGIHPTVERILELTTGHYRDAEPTAQRSSTR